MYMKDKYTINIYWIRHAFSCGNFMTLFKKNLQMPFIVPDTLLSGLGIIQTLLITKNKSINNILKKSDFIGCSILKRTLQTSLYYTSNINNKTINILPYINENYKNILPDFLKKIVYKSSIPSFYNKNIKSYKKEFNKIKSEINKKYKNNNKINWKYFNKVFKENNINFKDIKNNYDKFITETIVNIINDLIKKNPNKKTFNICLFSHGKFLKQNILNNTKGHVENTSIHLQNYIYQDNILQKKNKVKKIYPLNYTKKLALIKNNIKNLNFNNINDIIKYIKKSKKKNILYKDTKYKIYYYLIKNVPIIITGEYKNTYIKFQKELYLNYPKLYIGNTKQKYIKDNNLKYDNGCFLEVQKLFNK
mgnify:CR=1 FL=1